MQSNFLSDFAGSKFHMGKLANIDEVLFKYRQVPSSVCNSKRLVQIESTKRALLDAYKRRGKEHEAPSLDLSSELTSFSLCELYLKWAWWAFQSGRVSIARKHAIRALKKNFFCIAAMKIIMLTFLNRLRFKKYSEVS